MIVIIGSPVGRQQDGHVRADGLAALTAIAVARLGRLVQLVGRIGDDAPADAILQDLARAGVGHVAILRDAAHVTPLVGPLVPAVARLDLEAADVELALRYLTDFAVVVVPEAEEPGVVAVAAQAAAWGAASLIVVREVTEGRSDGSISGARIMDLVAGETDEAAAARIGQLAATLDRSAVVAPSPGRAPAHPAVRPAR